MRGVTRKAVQVDPENCVGLKGECLIVLFGHIIEQARVIMLGRVVGVIFLTVQSGAAGGPGYHDGMGRR